MNNFRLKETNPLVFLIILVVVSILISLDKKPFLALSLFVIVILVQLLWSDLKRLVLFKQSLYPILMGFGYVFFIWLTRYLAGIQIDYLYLLTLMGRFLIFASYTFLLINNVTTKRLTLTLIKYLKIPDRIGYAFMAVYNFVPVFRKELTQIQYTYAIRGLRGKGLFARIKNMFQYAIPLLVTSIRKGMRLSVSMENRGLGKFETRTYYQTLDFNRKDGLFLFAYLLLIVLLSVGLFMQGLIGL